MSKRMLIIYGTTEGQTRKIAAFAGERLTKSGCDAILFDAAEAPDSLDPADFDAVLVAASLHAGGFQSAVRHFVRKHVEALGARPNAFLSVSLSAAGDDADDWRGLTKCVADLTEETGWTPDEVHHAAGAFRYTHYDFFKRWVMKQIAKQRGAPVDTSRDWELTDWDALGAFADGFAARLKG